MTVGPDFPTREYPTLGLAGPTTPSGPVGNFSMTGPCAGGRGGDGGDLCIRGPKAQARCTHGAGRDRPQPPRGKRDSRTGVFPGFGPQSALIYRKARGRQVSARGPQRIGVLQGVFANRRCAGANDLAAELRAALDDIRFTEETGEELLGGPGRTYLEREVPCLRNVVCGTARRSQP